MKRLEVQPELLLLYSKMQEDRNKLRGELLKEPGLDDLGNSYPDPGGSRDTVSESVV